VDTGSAAVLRQDQEQARADVAIGGRGRVFLALRATGEEGYLPSLLMEAGVQGAGQGEAGGAKYRIGCARSVDTVLLQTRRGCHSNTNNAMSMNVY
jgi:hypothetical protein